MSGLETSDFRRTLDSESVVTDEFDVEHRGLNATIAQNGPYQLIIIMGCAHRHLKRTLMELIFCAFLCPPRRATNDLDDGTPSTIADNLIAIHQNCHALGIRTLALSVRVHASLLLPCVVCVGRIL